MTAPTLVRDAEPPVVGESARAPGSVDVAPPVPDLGTSVAVRFARSVLATVAVLALGFTLFLLVGSPLSEHAAQSDMFAKYRSQLALGTAPVGPVDTKGAMLTLGRPMALLSIPGIGSRLVVGEGTTSAALERGPGHLRSTVFPGGAGTSVVFGRAGTYGAPFAHIGALRVGTRIIATTGVGTRTFRVVAIRRTGDRISRLASGRARITLVTADGTRFLPQGTIAVDADSTKRALASESPVLRSVPPNEQPMHGDASELWALVLWLEGLALVVGAAVWLWIRRSPVHAWLLTAAPFVLMGTEAARQVSRLLPNLM